MYRIICKMEEGHSALLTLKQSGKIIFHFFVKFFRENLS